MPLAFGFHSLGNDVEAQSLAQRNDRLADCSIVRVRQDVGDEGAVDLDLVERQTLQVGQRRIAGAEIVERESDAKAAQGQHLGDHIIDVDQQQALGDFQFQA